MGTEKWIRLKLFASLLPDYYSPAMPGRREGIHLPDSPYSWDEGEKTKARTLGIGETEGLKDRRTEGQSKRWTRTGAQGRLGEDGDGDRGL